MDLHDPPAGVCDQGGVRLGRAGSHGQKETGLFYGEFRTYDEGLCVQCMHIGPYDTEPETLRQMDAFAAEQGYVPDFTAGRLHHEIYLGDPRRTAPEKLKTVLRHPVRKK